MEYKLSAQATKDIAEISAYIARDKPQAAARFVAELAEAFITLATMPNIGKMRKELHPLYHFFPHGTYLIVYDTKTKPLTIARIISGARNLFLAIPEDETH